MTQPTHTPAPIPKYSGTKPLADILFRCQRKGWKVDMTKFNGGSDWLTFEFWGGGRGLTVIFSPWNGKFIVKDTHPSNPKKDVLATEESTEYDNTPWYRELLDFIYIRADEGEKAIAKALEE